MCVCVCRPICTLFSSKNVQDRPVSMARSSWVVIIVRRRRRRLRLLVNGAIEYVPYTRKVTLSLLYTLRLLSLYSQSTRSSS